MRGRSDGCDVPIGVVRSESTRIVKALAQAAPPGCWITPIAAAQAALLATVKPMAASVSVVPCQDRGVCPLHE